MNARPFRDPTPSDGFSPRIVTIGGGKGGIGKSFVAAGMARSLAHRGTRVLVVDLDLGGANLHAWFGQPPVRDQDLGTFLQRGGPELEELIVRGPMEGLSLIPGASSNLGAPNLKYAVKRKVIQRLRRLSYDWIILDLAAGSNYNTLDFFLLGTRHVLVTSPERTSVENAYRFLRASLLRTLRGASGNHGFQNALRQAEALGKSHGNVRQLIAWLAETDPQAQQAMTALLDQLNISLIMNQIWDTAELKMAKQMKLAASRHLHVDLTILGPIRYDTAVIRELRQAEIPIDAVMAHEGVREDVRGIVDRLVRDTEYAGSSLGVSP